MLIFGFLILILLLIQLVYIYICIMICFSYVMLLGFWGFGDGLRIMFEKEVWIEKKGIEERLHIM